MKETIFVGLAAGAIGAVVGAFLTSTGAAGSPDGRPAFSERGLASALDSALGRRVADLQREVAGLRSDLTAARRTAAAEDSRPAAARDESRRIASAEADGGAHASPPMRRTRDDEPANNAVLSRTIDDPVAPGPQIDHVRALHHWEEDAAIRAKWLFVGERAAFEWFGTPDDIGYERDRDLERWNYEFVLVPDQDGDGEPEDTGSIQLEFRRGRLVGVSDYSDE